MSLGRLHLCWRHRPGCVTGHHEHGVQRRARRRPQHGALAWATPGWREAALEYRGGRVSITSYAPKRLAPLRRLPADDVSFGRAWNALHF
jgi:hypothetical protein